MLPLIAVALGGSTARWSEGVIVALVGLLLLAIPPRASLGWKINFVFVGLLAMIATAYLPAAWFKMPGWRAALVDDLGTRLPLTLGPQPWLTAESAVLFTGGMAWFYVVAGVSWRAEERLLVGRWFAGGVVALASIFIVCHRLHFAPSTWHTERGFGPFPNRNQTADFLAVGALPVLACAHLAWRAKQRGLAVAWFLGWAVIAAGLFQNFSRAGIVILFGGTILYASNEIFRALSRAAAGRGKDGGTTAKPLAGLWRVPALGASLVLLLATGFMLFGGETLQRLRRGTNSVTAVTAVGDFRQEIQRDAIDLIVDSPWCGTGLGSFEGVFPPYRTRSAVNLHVVHPESDWVWLTAELGWTGLVLVLAGAALLFTKMWPQRSGTDRPLRAAASFAALAFAAHGLVDVSGHRVGTAWCGLLLAGLALRGSGDSTRDFRRPTRWAAPFFRLLGLALATAGVTWATQDRGEVKYPGVQAVTRSLARSRAEAFDGRWQDAVTTATSGLAIDPLNWPLYFQRAGAELGAGGNHAAALADFRRVLFLERFSGEVAAIVAQTWARVGEPDLAVVTLLEACRRVPTDARNYIPSVCAASGNDPALFDRLAAATRSDPALHLIYLEQLPLAAQGPAVERLVAADPALREYDDRQRSHLFRIWLNDAPAFAAAMEQHPTWQKIGWRYWVRAMLILRKPERACQLAEQWAPKPTIPSPTSGNEFRTIGDLRAAVEKSPGSADANLKLYRALLAEGDKAGALAVLHALTSRIGSPAYFRYLEAELDTELGRWREGAEAWLAYIETLPGLE